MPIEVKYPGAYVEELPSSSHGVTGVSTSTTAFVGRALKGPVDKAIMITSFREFQRTFGGLCSESYLGYSVSDFFNNGGSEAFIVRLFKESTDKDSPPSKTQITIGDLKFEAANEGSWGESLIVEIDFDIRQESSDQYKLDKEKMFNLSVHESSVQNNKRKIINSESFTKLTLEDSKNRVDRILELESKLLRYQAGEKLPSDLSSVKPLAQNGKVSYSIIESIDSLKKKIDRLSKDKNDEKKKLEKQLKALKSSDGESLDADCFIGPGKEDRNKGIYALEDIKPQIFNLMCIPPYNGEDVDTEVITKAAEYCEKKRAILLVDPPSSWKSVEDAINGLSAIGTNSANAALYFPRVIGPDPMNEYKSREFAPSGAIGGIIARTDVNKGVWKAPAGIEAVLQGVELSIKLTDNENGQLNLLGINCLRTFPIYGNVLWGARTLQGNDLLQSEWKYINVRRLALYIEQSLEQGTRWAVFEKNDESLWSGLRMQIGSFMSELYSDGAFQGSSAYESYFVKVDSTTTTQSDIDQGVVNMLIGFAPVKPAEFIILRIQQITG